MADGVGLDLAAREPLIIVGRPSAFRSLQPQLGFLGADGLARHFELPDNRVVLDFGRCLALRRERARDRPRRDFGVVYWQERPPRLIVAGAGSLGTLAAARVACAKDLLDGLRLPTPRPRRLWLAVAGSRRDVPLRRESARALVPDDLAMEIIEPVRTDASPRPRLPQLCRARKGWQPSAYSLRLLDARRGAWGPWRDLPLSPRPRIDPAEHVSGKLAVLDRLFERTLASGAPCWVPYTDLGGREAAAAVREHVTRLVRAIDAVHAGFGAFLIVRSIPPLARRGAVRLRLNADCVES